MSRDSEINVVVTGVGAIIGQGIVRSLRTSGYPLRIIGVDKNERSPGSYMVDVFIRKPQVLEDSDEYMDFWVELIRENNIQLVVPGLEVDMYFFHQHRDWADSFEVVHVLNSASLIEITSDKWWFSERLKSFDYPVIPSVQTDHWEEALYTLGTPPLLMKPLHGNGSRGIVRLENKADFEYWKKKANDTWMLQRIVGSDHEEYTVGVFGLGDGKFIGPIIFRRKLSSAGNTLEANVVASHYIIESATERLCKHFEPVGPTNLQFRIEDGTPYLLEINPRFSSSNSLRTAFGFNEAKMAIEFYLHKQTPEVPVIKLGTGWRYSEDYVIYASHSL